MIKLFCGYDPREAVGFHTFQQSVMKRASKPVSFIPLSSMGLPDGSNNFTLSRFLVPYLCGFKGHAIFADACDMLMLGDLADLVSHLDPAFAVQVVKHPEYESAHARKYIGTELECDQSNYPRKNWASLMLINCEHAAWTGVTPEFIANSSALELLQFQFLAKGEVGELPAEWNVLIDEGQDDTNAKVLHWTAGIPTFKHYRNARRSKDWFAEHEAISQGAQ